MKNYLLTTLLEAKGHGVRVVDSCNRVVAFNRRYCEMWNLTEDLIYVGADGDEIAKYVINQTSDPELHISYFHEVQDSQNMVWEKEISLLNGKIFHIFSSPVRGLDGTYCGRVWRSRDITEDVL